jgi:hypothetical protein
MGSISASIDAGLFSFHLKAGVCLSDFNRSVFAFIAGFIFGIDG